MIKIKGKYNEAIAFTKNLEEDSKIQIKNLLSQKAFKHSTIRIMPDVHGGKACVLGFTGKFSGKIIPNIIGVDIGCGMYAIKLGNIDINFENLDKFIKSDIPFGIKKNKSIVANISSELKNNINNIAIKTNSDLDFHLRSIGSLGGGNHFIELNIDKEENKWLVIHSGSRNLGHQVATYHQKKAINYCEKKLKQETFKKNKKIGLLKQANKEITEEFIKEITKEADKFNIPKQLSYLEGEMASEYLKDMKTAQEVAKLNRETIANKICLFLGIDFLKTFKFHTIHNYFDFEDGTIRKGAISAKKDELVLIPINMRDGSILAKGKGNKDWNESAPHGAGRLMSRTKAKEVLNLEEFKETMNDVYSSTVSNKTLDEAPEAYKPIKDILDNIADTVEVLEVIKAIYNFKGN